MKKILTILFLFMCLGSYSQTQVYTNDTVVSPTGFTPKLTTNNKFKPAVYGYTSYQLFIYDRWGKIIFEGESWDGTYNNTLMPRGVYIWRMIAWKGNVPTEYYGHITLL